MEWNDNAATPHNYEKFHNFILGLPSSAYFTFSVTVIMIDILLVNTRSEKKSNRLFLQRNLY